MIRILRRNHGSERNWFKVLGGLTISVTIDPTTFKKSVAKVLCNTSHSNCASELVQYFLKVWNKINLGYKKSEYIMAVFYENSEQCRTINWIIIWNIT